jgi:hypothetical protein
MSYIPEQIRSYVIERAKGCCEYYRIHQDDSLYAHEVDHIIPEKHRGTTHEANLCLACLECNRRKGSDFASFDPETDDIALLFHPRQHVWQDHFRINGARIIPISSIGRVTEFVLKLNTDMRLLSRQALVDAGRYPQ